MVTNIESAKIFLFFIIIAVILGVAISQGGIHQHYIKTTRSSWNIIRTSNSLTSNTHNPILVVSRTPSIISKIDSQINPMEVREFTVNLVTNPEANFPNIWKKQNLINDVRALDPWDNLYWQVYISGFEHINGTISSDHPINFYVLDRYNFERFKNDLSFKYYSVPSRKNAYSFTFDWSPPDSGYYYLVIEPAGFTLGEIKIKEVVDKYIPPLPESIKETDVWRIWVINTWVALNIHYVPDPNFELVQSPNETLKIKAGDCDDVATLMASMYQAVGLKTKIALVDTDGDSVTDHVSVLVYYEGTSDSFLKVENLILLLTGLGSQAPEKIQVSYLKDENGIWIIADPLFSDIKYLVGQISHTPYEIVGEYP